MLNLKNKDKLFSHLKSQLLTDLIPSEIWNATKNEQLRPAAVLVPIQWHLGQWQILLTRRSEKLKHHSGQISFPGGGFEEQDGTIRQAAIRETNEELGIPQSNIKIAGYLENLTSISGFNVTPFVGVLEGEFEININQDEVAEAFYVPLVFFLDGNNCKQHKAQYKQEWHKYYVYQYQNYTIWGLTAQIIVELVKKLNLK